MIFDLHNPKAFLKNVDFFDPVSASASLIAGQTATTLSLGAGAVSVVPTVAAIGTTAATTAAASGGFLSGLLTTLQVVGGVSALTSRAGDFDTEADLTRDTAAQLREDARVAAISKRISDKKKIAKTKAATSDIFDSDQGTPLFVEALNEETSDFNVDNIIKAGNGQAGALDAEAELIQSKSTRLNVAAGIRAAGAGVSLLNS